MRRTSGEFQGLQRTAVMRESRASHGPFASVF